MKRAPPSTIPLQIYDTQNMSPLTKLKNAPNYFDNQSYSLFGDPIPPQIQQDQYLENLDNLYGRFRHNSDSSILDDFPKPDIFVQIKNEKPKHGMSLFSDNSKDNVDLYTVSGNPSLAQPSHIGPDIRILRDSDSSSDIARSPRNLIPIRDGNLSQQNISSINRNEPEKRKMSDYSEDFKSNYEKFRKSDNFTSIPKRIFPNEPINYIRNNSNESYSSNDWFKPSHDYEEFTKIPKLRPSSKNVMSINQHDTLLDSPVATLLNDFAEYSSEGAADEILQPLQPQKFIADGERLSKKREIGLHIPIKHHNLSIQGLPPPGPSYVKRETSPVIVKNVIATGADYRISPPRSHKKPSFIIIAEKSVPSSRPQSASQLPTHPQQQHNHQQHIKENIHTGAGRVSPFLGRGFKENLKLQPSQISEHPLPSSQLKLPVITSRNTKLNNLNTSDESPRPSVQFNMSMISRGIDGNLQQTPKRNFQSKHIRRPVSAIQTSINQNIRSFETLPNINGSSGSSITIRTPARKLSKSSTDLFQESRSASAIAIRPRHATKNPTSREKGVLRVINSATSSPSRIPITTNWIADNLDKSASKRSSSSPLRNYRRRSTSPERRSSSQTQPRSSISSFRRSSNLSSVTTSDFSYRRNSVSPMRRPSISPSGDVNKILPERKGKQKSPVLSESQLTKRPRGESISNYHLSANKNTNYSTRKVAKPTTLSPIIGTPNKDGPLTSEEMEIASKFAEFGDKKDCLTKIPIRNGSNVTSRSESRVQSRTESRAESRTNSHAPTAANSRSNSPQKDFVPYSRPNSRAESKSSTRVSSRSNSRAEISRPISRITSKSSSTADSKRPSRAKSRTNPRLDQKISAESKSKFQSKSKSSKSRKSPPKDGKKSISNSNSSSPNKSRHKSGSPIKKLDNSHSRSRGRSTSSKTTNSNSKNLSAKKAQNVNRNNSNRTNSRKELTSAKKVTSAKSQTLASKSTSSSVKKAKDLKKESSNLYRSSSNLKKDTPRTEPSPIKRSISNIKREASRISLKGDNANLIRENSNLKKVKPNSGNDAQKEKSSLKLNTDKIRRVPSLLRLRADSNLNKKLEKKGSSKNLENQIKSDNTTAVESNTQNEIPSNTNVESNGALIPLTKANVVSMTTAAITAQPVQITTAVTNQLTGAKVNSSGMTTDSLDAKTEDMSIPVAILEKSQKTLENIQKTVTEATDEIQKTINDNLTDLKTLETDIGKISSDIPAPLEKTDSKKSLKDALPPNNLTDDKNKSMINDESSAPPSQPIEASVSVVQGNNHLDPNAANKDNHTGGISEGQNLAEDMAERVSERAISVLPYVDCEDTNLQNYEQHQVDSENYGEDTVTIGRSGSPNNPDELMSNNQMIEDIDKNDASDNNNMRSDSQEYLDEEQAQGCCGRSRCSKCCSRFCMPCRRCQGSKCCKKKTTDDIETTSVIVKEVDEKPATKKPSCWKRMNCCKRKSAEVIEENIEQRHMETINEEPEIASSSMSATPKQSKCGMCLSKIFCCRATNKVEATTVDTEPVKKCCFCIPCKRKKTTPPIETAWQAPPDVELAQRRESILSAPAIPMESRCTRFMNKLKFWKKKDPSRRASMGSRKQSLAPTNPPEDTRPKLHNDLVDYNSKMKAAIPVLPIYLAYFCTGCNIIIPGLGTILSGLFCICVGIPRFSQYDSAKARLGSFLINCFVGVAQLFCVLFCFVGWGWSIWWGSIMMKTARKLQKIRKVEKLELEEEQRQAVLTAQATAEKKATETAGTKA